MALLVFSTATFAQNGVAEVKSPRWKQLTQAYGFIQGQQQSLSLIETKFPNLRQRVREAWFAFNSSSLGESVSGLDAELSQFLGDKWPEFQDGMRTQMDQLEAGSDCSEPDAIAFLNEVERRSRGEMPIQILQTLISVNPRYVKNPALELIEGWKQTFNTEGHPKAKGIDLTISLPKSWFRREGNRPNIIQFFQSGVGHGQLMCSLMTLKIPLQPGEAFSRNEAAKLLQPNGLKDMVPENATYIEAKSIALERSPAAYIVYDIEEQRLDLIIPMRVTQFVMISGDSMIFIQFMIDGTKNGPDTTFDDLQEQYFATFLTIANTLVLDKLYLE
jgi:hypothetical protein